MSVNVNELREVAESEGVAGSSRKLSALERERESYAAFERRKTALAEQNAAFERRQRASESHADTVLLSDVFAAKQSEFKRERARERRERRTKRVESLYESLDTVHEKLSAEQSERFLSATNASADPRETRARAVNMRYIASQFSDFRDVIESNDAVAYASIRSAVAVQLFATDAERDAIENARDESERATALRAFTEMSDVEFYEKQSARIAQRTERENVSNSVLLAVRDAVFKNRSASVNIDALEIYRAARSELIDARASESANAESNALQFNAHELDELRKQSLVVAERAKRDRESVNDTVEMLLYVFARDRKTGTIDEKFSEYVDETVESAIERLAQHSDDERSLIYYALGLRADDAEETAKARRRGVAGKLSEKTRRSFRDVARSHIENFEQSQLNERMQIAERLKRGERVAKAGGWQRGYTFYESRDELFANDDEKRRFIADTERDARIYRAAVEIDGVVDGTIDPAHFDNKWINALAEGPGQVAFMSQAAIGASSGIGFVLTASTMKALRTKELIQRGVPLQQATDIATISAVPEAMIERLQLNMLIGKGAAGRLIGNLVTEPTARALGKRAAVTFGTDMIMQTAQEQLQDAAPLAIQHIASWLDDKVPATTIEDWKELGASTPEVAVTMLIPVLLGTGAGTFRSRAFAREHMASEKLWRGAGFKEEVVQEITELVRVDKLKEAQALVQSSWNDANKRKARTAEQIEALEEVEAGLRAGGEMLAEHDITLRETDEGSVFEVRDRNGEIVDTAATPEAAIELARAVSERERAADERKRAEEEANAEPEVAGFESQHERVEEAQSEGEAEAQAEAQEGTQNTQNRGVLGMPAEVVDAEQDNIPVTPDAPKRLTQLAAQEPIIVESKLPKDEKAARAEAVGLYPKRAVFTNKATGRQIRMVNSVRGKLRSHSANLRTLKIIPALQQIVEEAIPLWEATSEDGTKWHYYGTAVVVDGESVFVRLAAFETREGALVIDYLHDAQTTPRETLEGEGVAPQDGSKKTNMVGKRSNPSKDKLVTWARAVKAKETQSSTAQPESTSPSTVLGSPLRQDRPNAARVSFEGEAAEAGSALAKRKKPVSMPEVMKALAKVIEAVGGKAKGMFRKGFTTRKFGGALGHYELDTQVTRLRSIGDITTAAHELAHALDALLFKPFTHWEDNRLGLSTEARAELEKLGKQLYGKMKPAIGYHSEGFAEFVRLWFTDREQATQKAPAFAAWLEGKLAEEPKLAKAMAHTQALAHRYLRQGSEARADSGIVETPTRLERAGAMTRSQMRDFRKNWIEAARSIEVFALEAARRRGREELGAKEDPYLTLVARRMTADAVVRTMATKGMVDWSGRATGEPALADAFALVGKGKGRVRQFLIYLWAKRTIALQEDPRGPRNSGLAIEDARYLVEKYERESPEFIRAAQIVYGWNAGVLNFAAQSSPALAETVRRIREVDPGFYIPLQREFSELDREYKAGGSGSAARAELSKRLEGSGRRIIDPVESMIAQAKNIVLKAQQRAVIDQIMQIARSDSGMGHWAVEVPVDSKERSIYDREVLNGSQDFGEKGPGALLEEMIGFFEPAHELKGGEPAIFSVWENGKMRRYELDRRLYDALARMDSYKMNPVIRFIFGASAATLRLGATGLNMSFAVTNGIKDFNTLLMNTRSSANSAKLFMTWKTMLKDSFLHAVSNGKISTETIDAAQRWGLEMASPLAHGSEPLVQAARLVKNGGKWSPFNAGDIYEWVKNVIQSTEMATRLTEIKELADEKGWDISNLTAEQMHELMRAGKQVTTDFTQAGAYARITNQSVPFFNAAIQGPVASLRALKRNPEQFLLRGAAMAAFSLAAWFRNKDEDWWKEMPMSERYRFTYFPLPNGDLLRIPRAFEVGGLFMAFPEALVDAWYAEDPKAVVAWFGEWMGTLLPPVLPVPLKWAGETIGNYDLFRRRSIEPKGVQYRPSAERFGPYTSKVAIKLAEVFDIEGVSPYRIDHAISSFFGGVGSDLVGLLGRGNSDLIDREWETADTPVFGVLFQRGGQRASRPKSVDSMHKAYRKALDKQNSIRHEETPEEKQQRLMLSDAVKAVGLYRDISLITKSKEARLELEKAQIQIAKEVMDLVKEGKVDRSVSSRARGEAQAAQREAMDENGIQPNGKKSRPIRDATSR